MLGAGPLPDPRAGASSAQHTGLAAAALSHSPPGLCTPWVPELLRLACNSSLTHGGTHQAHYMKSNDRSCVPDLCLDWRSHCPSVVSLSSRCAAAGVLRSTRARAAGVSLSSSSCRCPGLQEWEQPRAGWHTGRSSIETAVSPSDPHRQVTVAEQHTSRRIANMQAAATAQGLLIHPLSAPSRLRLQEHIPFEAPVPLTETA